MSVSGMKQARVGARKGPGSFFGSRLVARLAEDVETSARAPVGLGNPAVWYLAPYALKGTER